MNIRYSAIALAVMGFSASAQESPKFKQLLAMDLGEMLKVEVATGTAKQLSEAPAVVSVITSDDIESTGARTLREAVERVPGLHVMASELRLQPLYAVRGIHSSNTNQILVLIDSVDISEMTSLSTPYSFQYPTTFIERIEIIRGPGSAVYGADAFSGVINIITRTPESNQSVEAGGTLGSFDYFEAWVNANFVSGELKGNISFTHQEQDDDDDRITPYGVLSRAMDMNNLHINLEYGDYALKTWYWRIEQKMGVGAGLTGNDFDRDIAEALRTQFSWNGNVAENLDGSADISYSQNRTDALFQLLPAGIWPVGADGNLFGPPFIPVAFPDGVIGQPQGSTNKLRLNSSFIYSGYKNHRLRIGFGGESAELTDIEEFKNFGPGVLDAMNIPDAPPIDPNNPDIPTFPISNEIVDVSGTSFIFSPDYERDLWYLSVQDEWKFAENWELTAGVRYDKYSDFGSTTNPRLALVWNGTATITSKFLYGTAFRAPKVSELAFINNPAIIGNPDLQPEEIETFELAIDFRPNTQFTGLLNIFKYQSEQLIQLDQTFTYQNIGEQDGHGIELESNWQATENLRVNFNLSWLDSELPLREEDKAQVPGTMAHLDLRYQISPDWLFTLQNYWISDRKRESSDDRPDIDDYSKLDLTLIWRAQEDITASIGMKNAFNESYSEPSPNSALFASGLGFSGDFPMESRSIFGSISVEF